MKLTITGDAYALTSTIKVSDIALLKKYNPAALTIVDKETKKTLFGVDYIEGKPSVAPFGVTFSGEGRGEGAEGCATITKMLPPHLNTDEAKKFVAEEFGGVIAYLEQLEKSVSEAAKAVADKRKKLVDSITVA
ncbi:MAG: hypothetical protein OSJ83_02775 [Clostridia bacterium]|nr:hypothetical protein [Clostridia bacterium]